MKCVNSVIRNLKNFFSSKIFSKISLEFDFERSNVLHGRRQPLGLGGRNEKIKRTIMVTLLDNFETWFSVSLFFLKNEKIPPQPSSLRSSADRTGTSFQLFHIAVPLAK
jgi:hypothetical protein